MTLQHALEHFSLWHWLCWDYNWIVVISLMGIGSLLWKDTHK